jgi:hypothetical protein
MVSFFDITRMLLYENWPEFVKKWFRAFRFWISARRRPPDYGAVNIWDFGFSHLRFGFLEVYISDFGFRTSELARPRSRYNSIE